MPRENPAFCTKMMAILARERFLLLCRVRATNLALRGGGGSCFSVEWGATILAERILHPSTRKDVSAFEI